MAHPVCPQCGVQEARYQERLQYVTLTGKPYRNATMRVICGTCVEANLSGLPERASWVDVIDALKRYALDQTDPMWERVERAVAPFLAMGVHEPLL